MEKKNYTWKLTIETVKKLQAKAKKDGRSLTNYIQHLFDIHTKK